MQASRVFAPASSAFRSSSLLPPRAARLTSVRGVAGGRRRMVVEARQYVAGMGIMGTKAGMMSYFTPEGLCVPATVIALEEGNIVTMIKTMDTDGYNAVQVGYKRIPDDKAGKKDDKGWTVKHPKLTKPERGHLEKALAGTGVTYMKHLKEWRFKDAKVAQSFTPGQQLDMAELFKEGDMVDCAGTSIGKGFQGTIKRWGHKRGLMTHGSKSHRQHGSIGAATTPARVLPGLKMAGHMGDERITVRRQQILKVDTARMAIVIKGCVPGKPGALIEVHRAKIVGKNC